MSWLVIGISGVTNGGKTTLVKFMKKKFRSLYNEIKIVHMDDYLELDDRENWETLDTVNVTKLMEDIHNIIKVEPKGFCHGKSSILIVEGFLIFNHKPLLKLCNVRFFIDLPYDICLERRKKRKYYNDRPVTYFDQYVWPMYKKNRSEFECNDEEIFYLDGTKDPSELLDCINLALVKITIVN